MAFAKPAKNMGFSGSQGTRDNNCSNDRKFDKHERDDNCGRGDKSDKGDKYGKSEKNCGDDKHDKHDKYDKCEKNDKYDKFDRWDKGDKYDRHDRCDKHDRSHDWRDNCDNHGKFAHHHWHKGGHNDRCGRAPDVDLDKGRDGIDLDISMKTHGHYLCVDVDLGCRDFDFKFDVRKLLPDTSSLVTMVGGDGNAVGDNTLVDADIFSRLLDLGSISVAFGSANFTSAAVSENGFAFAGADTFADISGADLVFLFTQKTSAFSSEEGPSWATETSQTAYVAIDFEKFDLYGGPRIVSCDDLDLIEMLLGNMPGGGGHGNAAPQIEGNVAVLNVDALAQAENTHLDVASSILTVEDQLSSVSAVVVGAIA